MLGTVKNWNDEDGWGVLIAPDLPGEVFVHHTHIRQEHGYRTLGAGDPVVFAYDELGQDGCEYKAIWVEQLPRGSDA
jgi:CspA family cold shock protein